MRNVLLFISMFVFSISAVVAQTYAFEDFVGTWHGTISGTGDFGSYTDPMTMVIEPDGFYTETSGYLMPTIYPNTQHSDFEEETNRYHWWYLDVVYAGQYFYQNFYYEVVYFQNDTLIMHYNFWDDPEPHPEIGSIALVRETSVGTEQIPVHTTNNRKLLKVYDLTGREVEPGTPGRILIYRYDDGSSEKKLLPDTKRYW